MSHHRAPSSPATTQGRRHLLLVACLTMWITAAALASAARADESPLPKIAVFAFELEDSSASAAPSGERVADALVLRSVTRDA